MGNGYNLCETNNTQRTDLIIDARHKHQQSQQPEVSVIPTFHKSVIEFIQENKQFFQGNGNALMHLLTSSDQNFQQRISQFPLQTISEDKKIYLPALKNQEFKTYEGECIFIDYLTSQMYAGQVKKGQKQGYGIRINKKGNIYYGLFRNNIQNGEGVCQLVYPKRIYKGNWKDGKLQGSGQAIYQDEAKYQGSFFQGKKHGQGILTFPDGAVYQGSFQCDLMHGYGIFTSPKGRQINGEWKYGKYQIVKAAQRSSCTFSINQLPV